MTSTAGDMVNEVRSMLQGSLVDEVSVLAEDYVPDSGKVQLAFPRRNYQAGGLMCCGLNTWQTLKISSDGTTVDVLSSMDGGPDVAVSAGEVVRLKPRYTNWAIFREWNDRLSSMSSPSNGLYAYGGFTANINWLANTYALPTDWLPQLPLRLLVARYRHFSTGTWQRFSADWQPEIQAVRLYGPPPNGSMVEFVFAFPFLSAPDLSTDVTTLGLSEENKDIPGLGACQKLSLTGEARRNQLTSQGDARRAEEVQAGAVLGVSREFGRAWQARITEEHSRLIGLFGYWQPPAEWTGGSAANRRHWGTVL